MALGWFNVRNYGAQGDGTTDDTASVNAAIAALIAAGRGVLYFPAGSYKTTSALTTISVSATVQGDGTIQGTSVQTKVISTSDTANLFTVTADGCLFRDMALINTHGDAPTAGAAIDTTGGGLAGFDNIRIDHFYNGIDLENSSSWWMRDSYLNSFKYGIRIRNTAIPDGGDWSISGCTFSTINSPDAAIRIDSSGGGKIVNCKINGGATTGFQDGIQVAIGAAVQTADLLISNTSIENFRRHGIHVAANSGGTWANILVTGVQIAVVSASGGNAIKLDAATLGDLKDITVTGCVFSGAGTSEAAISLTKVDNAKLATLVYSGFTGGLLTTSGCTNVVSTYA